MEQKITKTCILKSFFLSGVLDNRPLECYLFWRLLSLGFLLLTFPFLSFTLTHLWKQTQQSQNCEHNYTQMCCKFARGKKLLKLFICNLIIMSVTSAKIFFNTENNSYVRIYFFDTDCLCPLTLH